MCRTLLLVISTSEDHVPGVVYGRFVVKEEVNVKFFSTSSNYKRIKGKGLRETCPTTSTNEIPSPQSVVTYFSKGCFFFFGYAAVWGKGLQIR